MARSSLYFVSSRWTGSRITLDWSDKARFSAWRIHQDAYVLNLTPLPGSNLSTARIKPMLPSCTRSCRGRPE